ncbi:aromatic amino acid transporter [compost metagenome]
MAFVVLILGIMLMIPGIQVSVYAIPVWLFAMFVIYMVKPRRRMNAGGVAGTAAK